MIIIYLGKVQQNIIYHNPYVFHLFLLMMKLKSLCTIEVKRFKVKTYFRACLETILKALRCMFDFCNNFDFFSHLVMKDFSMGNDIPKS
jgi:hypothetical protein